VRPAFPFVVGSQRSGTTLVRAMLDSHPLMSVPPESWFVTELASEQLRYSDGGAFDAGAFLADLEKHPRFERWELPAEATRAAVLDSPAGDFPEAVRRVFELFACRRGKSRYGDKTPPYVERLPLLAELFEEACFLHVIRDGRDVATSAIDAPWGPDNAIRAALDWRTRVEAGRRAGRALGHERYLEIRYEALVGEPERTLRTICAFVALDFDPAMFSYVDRADELQASGFHANVNPNLARPPTSGLRDWRTQMAPADILSFELVAGDLLDRLGYERSQREPSDGDVARAAPGLVTELERLRRRVSRLEGASDA